MSRTFRQGDRRIRVRGIQRARPDLPKLARALIDLALAQAEAEAQAEHETARVNRPLRPTPRDRRHG
jgi:hypothetical protein